MGTTYIGEIRIFGGFFAPLGWAFCDGSLLPIAENDALFNLIGTTYGGDGQENFAVPDLRGRVPMHQGNGAVIGEMAGVESVTLTTQQIASHNHVPNATNDFAQQSTPIGLVPGRATASDPYGTDEGAAQPMSPTSYSAAGGSEPHENRQPYMAMNFIISLFGVYPPPN